jgi:hypothetical protein
MRAAGSVDHPNVVETHDGGEYAGTVYLAMKLVAGVNLTKLIEERGPLPVAEACDIARQVALGLEHLAERGLVHRDIKPSNLMRTPEGVVKILDLGLARWRTENPAGEDLTGAGQTLGTPDYLAPEQLATAAEADIRADLYGLGGTLFFLLTGRAPFAHRRGLYAKLEAAKNETPPDVRSLRPEISMGLAELVKRLLAKRSEDRPQTPGEVAAALEAFAGDCMATLPATLADGPAVTRHDGRRRRVPVAVGMLGLAVLVGLGLWRLATPTQQPDTAPPAELATNRGEHPVSAEPMRVVRMDVLHIANLQGKGQTRGVLGKKSFAARRGDAVTVVAELSQPAYAYLIAFRPDGTEDLCFPERADQPPPLTDRPRFPSASQELEYGLDDGEGLEVFALVASSNPLPPYKEWRMRRGAAPWKPETTPAGVVWWYDGSEAEGLTDKGEQRGAREAEGRAAVVRLAKWLCGKGEGTEVSAVGFAVLPKDKP